MKKRRMKYRLAVSTVVANTLMIIITMSLASILVAWVGTTYGLFAGGSQQFLSQRGQAMPERFVVENVFFVKSSSRLKVFVRNTGSQPLNIVAIYVNGTSYVPNQANLVVVSPCAAKQVNNNWVVNETIGSVCEFDLTIAGSMDPTCAPSPWCKGDVFNIVVATLRGNQASLTTRAP
jgi:archaellum component FlaF (FlaF/FlaG flagellin family)